MTKFGVIYKKALNTTMFEHTAVEWSNELPWEPCYVVEQDTTFSPLAANVAPESTAWRIYPPYASVDSHIEHVILPPGMQVIDHPSVAVAAGYNYNIGCLKQSSPYLNGVDDDEEGCVVYYGEQNYLIGNDPTECLGDNTYRVPLFAKFVETPTDRQVLVLRAGDERIARTLDTERGNVDKTVAALEFEYYGSAEFSDFAVPTKLLVITARMMLSQLKIVKAGENIDSYDVLRFHVLEKLFKEEFNNHTPDAKSLKIDLFSAAIPLICIGTIAL